MALTHEEIRKIVQMRGIGYSHQEIADHLGISRKTVENHLRRLKQQTKNVDNETDLETLFWGILIGAGASAVISHLLKNQTTDELNQSHKRYNYKE